MTTDNYKAYFLKDSDKKQKSSTMYNQYRKTTDPGTEGQQARNSVDFQIQNGLSNTGSAQKPHENINEIREAAVRLYGKEFTELTNLQKVMLYKQLSVQLNTNKESVKRPRFLQSLSPSKMS